jgi:hypothetical protein
LGERLKREEWEKRVIFGRKTEEIKKMGEREKWVGEKIIKKESSGGVYLLLLKTKIIKKFKGSWLNLSHVALLYSFF